LDAWWGEDERSMNARAAVARNRTSRARHPESARGLLEQSVRVRDDLRALADAASHLARGWQSLVRDRMQRQPYATLAAAAGVGYVLGGGVPTTLLRVLVGVGGRIAVERLMAQVVSQSDDRPT
jgi:ElaB/YqjD/DUF883 family membrane-anchored ribosome-binding protein